MSREYGKVSPSFWTGETGRRLRELGRDAQLVALYLITGPTANMIGLYHLALPTLCHYTGLSSEGAMKALRRVQEGGFAYYEAQKEEVWVPEMAAHQVGEPLDIKDNRVKGIIREWNQHRKSSFYMDFYKRYRDSFHLPKPSPLEDPSETLRSQEQEQEQEQEQKITPPKPPRGGAVEWPADFLRFWDAYPRKEGKGAALKAWEKIRPGDELLGKILAALESRRWPPRWLEDEGRFIPHPSTWLNQRRWEDEGLLLNGTVKAMTDEEREAYTAKEREEWLKRQ